MNPPWLATRARWTVPHHAPDTTDNLERLRMNLYQCCSAGDPSAACTPRPTAAIPSSSSWCGSHRHPLHRDGAATSFLRRQHRKRGALQRAHWCRRGRELALSPRCNGRGWRRRAGLVLVARTQLRARQPERSHLFAVCPSVRFQAREAGERAHLAARPARRRLGWRRLPRRRHHRRARHAQRRGRDQVAGETHGGGELDAF
mmetsp:Transcript_17630/g.45552  ORF Transcript_17630/g.45552 Transcript_17630/m.45552 type:complete len:202 (-) Transcript_17630:632-1237(-)